MQCFGNNERVSPNKRQRGSSQVDGQRGGMTQFMHMHGHEIGASGHSEAQKPKEKPSADEKIAKLRADYVSFREKGESYEGTSGALKALKDGAILAAKIIVGGAIVVPATIVYGAVMVAYRMVFLGAAVIGGTLMVAAGTVGLIFTDQEKMTDAGRRRHYKVPDRC